VETDEDVVNLHSTDWLKQYGAVKGLKNMPGFMLKPESTDQVSEILKFCSKERIPVTVQGGNTGLVGGGVPLYGNEIVMSMSRMNRIRDFDENAGVLTCEAGCILANLEEKVGQHGYIMPLDLGASGSCEIGGNIATNAGGIRLIRYGSLRSHVLGLEIVKADGAVLDLMNTLRKDNTGYDLKQLFIGSEGTLGVITCASLTTPPKPKSRNVALLGLNSFSEVVSVLRRARTDLSEILSAVEFWDIRSMELVEKECSDAVPSRPIAGDHDFYLLIETAGSNCEHDEAKFMEFLEDTENGILAQDKTKADALWAIRENFTVALRQRGGYTFKFDVSLPILRFSEATNYVKTQLESRGYANAEVFQYGHIGDGNLHLNVWAPEHSDDLQTAIEDSVYGFVAKFRGSVSAEHGIGIMKASKLHLSKSPEAIKLMQIMKHTLDPHNILNPGKVLSQ